MAKAISTVHPADGTPWLQDDGCEASTSCLTCPLPKCKHDYPRGASRGFHRALLDYRVGQRLAVIPLGEYRPDYYETIAQECSVTLRTVYRSVKRILKESAA